MSFHFTLQKVMELKGHEKGDAERAYTESVKEFKKTAAQLYEFLKRKEELMEEIERKLTEGLSISAIQFNEKTISYLQSEIDRLQLSTHHARKNMNEKEKYLMYKSIDLKKYEKMKEIKQGEFLQEEKRQESKFLDDVSVQQFLRR
jgi:flagellar protein FliJ